MKTAQLIFPHQLFKDHPLVNDQADCFLIEAALFFTQYKFHQQKIAFHRASMRAFAAEVENQVKSLTYIEAHDERADIRTLVKDLSQSGVTKIISIDSTDNYLERQLTEACEKFDIERITQPNQLFISELTSIKDFFKSDKNNYFHHQFYQQQRKRLRILIDENNKPKGGQWSFDEDNRKKYPKDQTPPDVSMPAETEHHTEARAYVQAHFADHLGHLKSPESGALRYPINHQQAEAWLAEFFQHRFKDFGRYEDAMVKQQLILHHSLLTPMLNVGLLSPQLVIDNALQYAQQHAIPLNSLEGFIRQIIGWREFIRGLYETVGSQQRTRNYWQFKRPIPASFYTGETGIVPVDETIKKVLATGYCHHIERLMVLGNFMLLCEFDPDAVYQWFMELFIDAYDWVMVPNVYGMSQFADGGLMATKPYISSSNYILKMSDYSGGKQAESWRASWDGLFWRFMHKQRSFFESNPRIGMLLKTWDRMGDDKQQAHLDNAEKYLSSLA